MSADGTVAETPESKGPQNTEREDFEFAAAVPQMMSVIINGIYSSKDIFLRELVSNSSDALTKLLTERQKLVDQGYENVPFSGEFKIRLIPDKENGTLTIQDNGVGMTKTELISYLGSLASSGTKKFRQMDEALKKGENMNSLIGQFGLGFYSAFLVADQVTVLTKSFLDRGYKWTSESYQSYSIEPCDLKENGTSVILKLKKGDEAYLEESKLTEIIKKHSAFVKYPISLVTTEEEKEEKKNEDAVEEVTGEEETKEEVKEEQKEEEVKEPKIVEKVLNNTISIWDRKFQDIPEEELVQFYKEISNDYEKYLHAQMWHFEGFLDVKVLLFIPKRCQVNFFTKPSPSSTNIHLFCANVLVTDKLSREVVPEWMDFVVGAVSSPDFPMNVSREFLQGNSAINMIKKKLPKCILEMLKSIAKDEEEYTKFYDEFSRSIKAAVRMTSDNLQESFASYLRYETNQEPDKLISLDKYLSLVPETQKQILVLTALNKSEFHDSLYLEVFKDKTVLLMSSADDEALLQGFNKYKGMAIQMISKEGVEGVVSDEVAEENKGFCDAIKEQLGERVERVELSKRFSDVPAMLFSTKYAVSGTMERILKAQPKSDKDIFLQMMLRGKQIFELNLENPLVRRIKDYYDEGEKDKIKDHVEFLFDAARLGCGYSVEDSGRFVKQMYKLLSASVSKE